MQWLLHQLARGRQINWKGTTFCVACSLIVAHVLTNSGTLEVAGTLCNTAHAICLVHVEQGCVWRPWWREFESTNDALAREPITIVPCLEHINSSSHCFPFGQGGNS